MRNLKIIIVASLLVIGIMHSSLLAKEDTSRPIMKRWKVNYWGNDNVGLSYEEMRGRFGVVHLSGLNKTATDPTNTIVNNMVESNKRSQAWIERRFTSQGLYYQRFTSEGVHRHSGKVNLEKLVRELGIHIPVGSVDGDLWEQCQLRVDGKKCSGIFLIDPYGRIAGRTHAGDRPNNVQHFKLLPYEQMAMEIAEYWLEEKAGDIGKADKFFKRKKWKQAYQIYQPLVDKVKTTPAGVEIARKVAEIENKVRASILDSMCNLTAKNIVKSMAPLKRAIREYKGTTLAEEASRQLAVFKRAKNDSHLRELLRLHAANTLARSGRNDDAKALYQNLADTSTDEQFKAELAIRINGELVYEEEYQLDPSGTPEEWVEKAVKIIDKAEVEIKRDASGKAKQSGAMAWLASAAEHLTAAITQSEKELPGLREQLQTVRARIFWLAGQS
ncbi:hypothetical protein ACFL54_06225 [Planctomycetota bacterium]